MPGISWNVSALVRALRMLVALIFLSVRRFQFFNPCAGIQIKVVGFNVDLWRLTILGICEPHIRCYTMCVFYYYDPINAFSILYFNDLELL